MTIRPWTIAQLIGLCLLVGGAGSAIAQSSPENPDSPAPEAAPPSADTPTVDDAEGFETYTLPDTFSIQIPVGSTVDGSAADGRAVITSYGTEDADVVNPEAIAYVTEIMFVDEHPDTFVAREVDALIEAGYLIERYGLAAVQGNKAFRIWIAEWPTEFANQVITFVGYDENGTAKIVTSYDDTSAETTDEILYIHRSFERIEDEQ